MYPATDFLILMSEKPIHNFNTQKAVWIAPFQLSNPLHLVKGGEI